jgi:hypothetical protein
MTAADGAFDAPVELATARLASGTARRLIFVRGQDSTGAWGPVRAVYTPDPGCAASSVAPASHAFDASGGTATVTVTIPSACTWRATSEASWITITGDVMGLGGGTVQLSVTANPESTSRTGTLTIAGHRVSITEDGRAMPDLVTTVTGSLPAAAIPGAKISVTSTTRNIGSGTAGASSTRFYLGASASRSSGDTLLSPTRKIPSLAAGATSTGTVLLTVPRTITLGTYRVFACADDLGGVGESDETNGCAASATTIAITYPDLVPTALDDPPATAVAGTAFAVADTIRNDGAVTVVTTTTRYYLSLNRTRDGADRLLSGKRVVPSLAPGATSSGHATVRISSTTRTGTYFVLACADDFKKAIETNEGNNCVASAQPVQVLPRP